MKRLISYVIIIIGIAIMLYPKANEWYLERQESKLLEAAELGYEQNDLNNEDKSKADNDEIISNQTKLSYEKLSQILEQQSEVEQTISDNTESPIEVKTEPAEPEVKPIAIIKIAKIDLKLPVLEGATKENMSHAATHMIETTPLGKIGNAAISAHRAHKKGRLFNRLNEVELGDEIIIEMKNETFKYSVYKISRVKPTDVSVLNRNKKDKILTLITCDPLINPTMRLIVQAKIID
ncbi:class D sortase [Paenibacillus segetis]|uniref:Sortase A n=1 Tax=Paenibacillus segetis TaxID=1325360 RepID=A0ABQ1YWW7_9BACL|nr:class D sortase [Paenibacillus segetis]GGH40795.1 hypothetical protein GCM10008013_50480 [Paenibacillus segetis]